MKHASPQALERLARHLDELRGLSGLQERKPGVFYRRSRAFLHFHEDGDDLYADVRISGADFERFRVTSRTEQQALLRHLRVALK